MDYCLCMHNTGPDLWGLEAFLMTGFAGQTRFP